MKCENKEECRAKLDRLVGDLTSLSIQTPEEYDELAKLIRTMVDESDGSDQDDLEKVKSPLTSVHFSKSLSRDLEIYFT